MSTKAEDGHVRGKPRPMEDRMRAAMAYVITGSSVKASKLCNIPHRTIRDYTYQDWWPDAIQTARDSKDEELDAIYVSVIHESMRVVADRIQNGDSRVDKQGNLIKVPVSARDAAWIGAVMKDKINAHRGIASKIIKNTTADDVLNTIKKGLEDIAKPSSHPLEKKEEDKAIVH